ncbi:MAG TPA: RNA polymerase sigma-70 factor [Bacteroidales bacterium]|nr:RNA polymerase sigma-70 factor [Bacteroidales bacterium]
MDILANDLWNKIRLDDEKAFDVLFKEYYTPLCNFANRILNDLPEAEENVQDAFINLWQNRERITINGSLKSYLYQTVHNMAINRLEHRQALKNKVNKLASVEEWGAIHNTFEVNESFIQIIEANETEEIIRQVVNDLPEKCREVFLLSRYENLSNEKIGEILHLSQNTIRVQIFRALNSIREMMKKINMFFFFYL